jgi:hypothetical protein
MTCSFLVQRATFMLAGAGMPIPGHMHRGHDLRKISLKLLCESTQD